MEPRRLLSAEIFPQQGIATDYGAKFTAVADFDEDGHMDIATANHSFGVSVRLGNGDGTFRPDAIRTTATIPAEATAFEHADFNSDGHQDVVLLDGFGYVYIFLGDGDGHLMLGFNTLVGFAGADEGHFEIDDLNHDSVLDLVVSGYRYPEIKTLLGVGDGTFGVASTITFTNQQTMLDVADVTADGNMDMVVFTVTANGQTTGALLFRGNGGGTFQAGTSLPIPVQSLVNRLEIADLNHDGWMDLIFSNASTLRVTGGTGPGTFAVGPPSSASLVYSISIDTDGWGIIGHESIIIQDLDGNGFDDIAFSTLRSKVEVLLNQGVIRTMTHPTTVMTGLVTASGVALADFNEDGLSDLIWTNANVSSISMAHGLGNGRFATPAASSFDASSAISADFNSDGRDDLMFAGTGRTVFYLSAADATPVLKSVYTHATLSSPFALAPRTGDFNGDGFVDAAILRNGELTLLIGHNDGTFTDKTPINFGTSADTKITVADVNGDGCDDVVAASEISVAFGSTAGVFLPPSAMTALPTGFAVAAMADLNGDLRSDRIYNNGNVIQIALGAGDGTFATPTLIHTDIQNITALSVADFDKNGWIDITFTARLDADLLLQSVYLNDHGSLVLLASSFPSEVDGAVKSSQIQDVNADGYPDVVFTTATVSIDAASVAINVLLNDRSGMFDERVTLANTLDSFVFGDFNGDSAVDYRISPTSISSAFLFLNQNPPDRTAPTIASATADWAVDNRIVFTFSEPIKQSLTVPNGIEMQNLTTGQVTVIPDYTISANGLTLTATVPLSQTPGDYRVRLPQASVTDLAGNPLAQQYDIVGPTLFWLPGDANRDRVVNFADLLIVAQNYGQTGRTFSQGNFNYDAEGRVNFDDLLIISQRYGSGLFSSASAIGTPGKRTAGRLRGVDLFN